MFSLLQWGCGLVLQKQTEQGFLFVSFRFLQWKFWSGENWVDALVSGEERFLDLGKIFLPYSLSSGYLSISGLLWLQKVFSFWPFLYSGDSCCGSPAEPSPSACLHRERVTPSVIPARIQRAGDRRAYSGALRCWWSWDVTRLNKMPGYREQERPLVSRNIDCCNISFPAFCGVRISSVFRSLILLQTVVVAFILFSSLLFKTHQQRQIASYPIKSVCA